MCLVCKSRQEGNLAAYFEFLDKLKRAALYGAEHDFFIAFIAEIRKGATVEDATMEAVKTYVEPEVPAVPVVFVELKTASEAAVGKKASGNAKGGALRMFEENWNHALCERCYGNRHPDRVPRRTPEQFRVEETCCGCGCQTRDGIPYRADPQIMNCKGKHGAIPILGTVS